MGHLSTLSGVYDRVCEACGVNRSRNVLQCVVSAEKVIGEIRPMLDQISPQRFVQWLLEVVVFGDTLPQQ